MLFTYVAFAVVLASHGSAAPTSKNTFMSRQFQDSNAPPPECANDCAEYVALANSCGGFDIVGNGACFCNPRTLNALDICFTCLANLDIANGIDPAEAEAFRDTTVIEFGNGCATDGFPITPSAPPADGTPVNGNPPTDGAPVNEGNPQPANGTVVSGTTPIVNGTPGTATGAANGNPPASTSTTINGGPTINGTPANADPAAAPPATSDVVPDSGSEKAVASTIAFGIVPALIAAAAGSLVLV